MELLLDPQVWLAFATLTALEIVLGIDNIIFISILVGRLPLRDQKKARLIGLSLAMIMRIGLLLSITWIMGLSATLFTILNNDISGRDLILLAGGGFLIFKSTIEIHNALEGEAQHTQRSASATFAGAITQIALIDIVFSFDSVITAVGLVEHVEIMIAAIVVAVLVMMVSSAAISSFIERHPTLKMLALSFLLLIGVALIGEGFGFHIPKGYIYFSMAFAVLVEMLNMRVRKRKRGPVKLRRTYTDQA